MFHITDFILIMLLFLMSVGPLFVSSSVLEFEPEADKSVVNSSEISECSPTCKFGICKNETFCDCFNGYTGDDCSVCENCTKTGCPLGKYGAGCKRLCKCNHGTCGPLTATCYCDIGYTGVRCSKKCQKGTYGYECQKKCDCGQSGCDHVTGICKDCPPGYAFKPPNCKYCRCVSNDRCSVENYTCVCNENWIGEQCQCYVPGTEFTLSNNMCICKTGWTGNSCTIGECPIWKYGENCSMDCLCQTYGTQNCDDYGTCHCKANFSGGRCEKCKCDENGNCKSSKWDCVYADIVERYRFLPIFTSVDVPKSNVHTQGSNVFIRSNTYPGGSDIFSGKSSIYKSGSSIPIGGSNVLTRSSSIYTGGNSLSYVPSKTSSIGGIFKKGFMKVILGIGGAFAALTTACCCRRKKNTTDKEGETAAPLTGTAASTNI